MMISNNDKKFQLARLLFALSEYTQYRNKKKSEALIEWGKVFHYSFLHLCEWKI